MSITLKAMPREDIGKGASRRLRRVHQIPAIIYGAGKDTSAVSLDFYELNYLLQFEENIFTSVITIKLGKTRESVIIKDLQRHPASNNALHIDLLRIDKTHKLTTMVPLAFTNQEQNQALRLGAVLNQFIDSVEVVCLAQDLPNNIEVDVKDLELGDSLSLTDLKVPKGVEIRVLMHEDIEAYNQTVVAVAEAKKMAEIEEEEVATKVETEEETTEVEEKEGKDNKEVKTDK